MGRRERRGRFFSAQVARSKIFDEPQQHPRAGIRIRQIDMLVGMMADAASAAHENHRHIGDIDHRHAVVARAAWQFEHAVAFRGDRRRHLLFQPWCAGHGAVFMGHVEVQRKLSPLCDRFDLPNDFADCALAVVVRRRADIDGEVCLPGITLVAPGEAWM